jgi:hypothetical protein
MQVGAHTVSKCSRTRENSSPVANRIRSFPGRSSEALYRTRTDDPFLTMSAHLRVATGRLRVLARTSWLGAPVRRRLRVGSWRLRLPSGFHRVKAARKLTLWRRLNIDPRGGRRSVARRSRVAASGASDRRREPREGPLSGISRGGLGIGVLCGVLRASAGGARVELV